MMMHSYNPAYLRSKNRGVVLQMFLQHKELSKADITKQSNCNGVNSKTKRH